jgi:serine/threonine protein kinase
MKLVFGIAEGMRHLAAIGLGHPSLSLSNVLLDSQKQPKISDFGMELFRKAQPTDKGEDFSDGIIV